MIQPNDKIYREIDIFDKSPAQHSNKEDLCISASSSLPDLRHGEDKKKPCHLNFKHKNLSYINAFKLML